MRRSALRLARGRTLSSAAVVEGSSTIPTAPGRLPLVGHALNFTPQLMHEYLERTAHAMDCWAFTVHFGQRSPVVVGDPSLAQALLSRNSGWGGRSAAVLPFFLDSSEAIVGTAEAQGVAFANGPFHHGLARQASEDGLLRSAFVERSNATISAKSWELRGALRGVGGAAVDVQQLYARTALDIVGKLAFEAEIGSMAGEQTELEAKLKGVFEGIGELISSPVPYWRWLPAPAYDRYVAGGRRLVEMLRPIVDGRRAVLRGGAEATCFIDMLLERAPEYSDEEVIWSAVQILSAGYDTTSNTLAFTSLLLASRPALQADLRAEITAATPPDGRGRPVEAAHVAKLPLLNAVLKESMRLYPAAPLLGRLYERDDEPFVFGGAAFAKGASALVSPYLLGRNPRVWPDPLEFRPDRFLPPAGRAGDASHPYAWLPFGFGARGCVGMKLAMIEAKIMLGQVVRDFDIALAPAQRPDPEPILALTLSNKGGVHLELTPLD